MESISTRINCQNTEGDNILPGIIPSRRQSDRQPEAEINGKTAIYRISKRNNDALLLGIPLGQTLVASDTPFTPLRCRTFLHIHCLPHSLTVLNLRFDTLLRKRIPRLFLR